MNPGGGPDRDDTGLPPVDIEIPDDARELDRDVQAYPGEQRARRRRLRSGRLHGALSRDSMVMPLLICCLIFALITGTLLTFFTSTSIDQAGLPGSGTTGGKPASPGAAPTPGLQASTKAPGELATAQVQVAGHPRPVRALGPAILLVAPAGCGCGGTLSEIGVLASRAGESVYLVSAAAQTRQTAGIARQLGHGVRQATDVSGVLKGSDYPHAGLTAILVTRSGFVSYEQQLQGSTNLQGLIGLG